MKTQRIYVKPHVKVLTMKPNRMIAMSDGEQRNAGVNSPDDEVDASEALTKGRSEGCSLWSW